MKTLTMESAIGAMEILVRTNETATLSSLGVSEADVRVVQGRAPWAASERARITRTLDTLVYGAMDLMGIPRFPVSAEHGAAAIYLYVDGANTMAACRWLADAKSAEELMGESGLETERVTPSKLLALVANMYGNETALTVKDKFEKKANGALAKLGEKENDKETKDKK